MAPIHYKKNRFGTPDEKPRSGEFCWRQLAAIVYGWTDSRGRQLDRAGRNTSIGSVAAWPAAEEHVERVCA